MEDVNSVKPVTVDGDYWEFKIYEQIFSLESKKIPMYDLNRTLEEALAREYTYLANFIEDYPEQYLLLIHKEGIRDYGKHR